MAIEIDVMIWSSGLVARNPPCGPSNAGSASRIGPESAWSTSPDFQNRMLIATVSTERTTMIRERSSSRWSTRSIWSSGLTRRGRFIGGSSLLGRARGRLLRRRRGVGGRLRGRGRLDRRGRGHRWGVVVIVPAHRVLELPDTPAERLSHLGKALGPEHDQGDDQDDDELNW